MDQQSSYELRLDYPGLHSFGRHRSYVERRRRALPTTDDYDHVQVAPEERESFSRRTFPHPCSEHRDEVSRKPHLHRRVFRAMPATRTAEFWTAAPFVPARR